MIPADAWCNAPAGGALGACQEHTRSQAPGEACLSTSYPRMAVQVLLSCAQHADTSVYAVSSSSCGALQAAGGRKGLSWEPKLKLWIAKIAKAQLKFRGKENEPKATEGLEFMEERQAYYKVSTHARSSSAFDTACALIKISSLLMTHWAATAACSHAPALSPCKLAFNPPPSSHNLSMCGAGWHYCHPHMLHRFLQHPHLLCAMLCRSTMTRRNLATLWRGTSASLSRWMLTPGTQPARAPGSAHPRYVAPCPWNTQTCKITLTPEYLDNVYLKCI